MEIIANYDHVKQAGLDALMAELQHRFPQLELYSLTSEWFFLGRRCSAKATGMRGDVIVRWS